MKNGTYTIKIKLDGNINEYDNYQIIYVNDVGEIKEYIDAHIDGEYIVFETSHLSQYGIIATPVLNIEVDSFAHIDSMSVNWINVFKVSILVGFIIVSISLIVFITLKSNLLVKKKRKRKKA